MSENVATENIKEELDEILNPFLDKINEFRVKHFVDGKGLTLINLSKNGEIKIKFVADVYSLKSTS